MSSGVVADQNDDQGRGSAPGHSAAAFRRFLAAEMGMV